MKAIKSILAISVLVTAGTANATTWNIDLTSHSYLVTPPYYFDMSYQGTWDDVALVGTMTGTTKLTGTGLMLNNTLAFTMNETTGAGTIGPSTSCTDNNGGTLCASVYSEVSNFLNTVGTTSTAYQTPAAFAPMDGAVYTWTFPQQVSNNVVYIPTQVTLHAPAVPVPAAAWLFGSGLIGVAGVARKSRSKSV